MIIGVAKEIKNNEFRVGMTPSGAEEMRRAGHAVLIEAGAGAGSGFSDAAYEAAGAEVLADKRALFDRAEMIVKVKEPLASEYDLLHAGQILFTYLHLAAEPELAAALLRKKVIGIAYETVRGPHGAGLPLLAPMSEIAGRMSVQIGAHFLESHSGGSGSCSAASRAYRQGRSSSSAAATSARTPRASPWGSVRVSRSSTAPSTVSATSTSCSAAAWSRRTPRAPILPGGCAQPISSSVRYSCRVDVRRSSSQRIWFGR